MIDISLALLLPIALVVLLLSMALYYVWALMPRAGTAEWIHLKDRPKFSFIGRFRLTKYDFLIAVAIVLVWSAFTMINLGDRTAPQSFERFADGEYVEIDLGAEHDLGRVRYYTGPQQGNWRLYFSNNGNDWHPQGAMTQTFAQVFQWREAQIIPTNAVRFVRLVAESHWDGVLWLGELVLYNQNGARLNPAQFALRFSNPAHISFALFDEQDIIPETSSFLNSAYFDEVYHPRTAYEHLHGMWPYEVTHPPLGKLIIALGVQMFGMTPFGWRIAGAISGALILGIFYLLVKQMFGKRFVAATATVLFATSFMHFAQTRIATIDTYAVLFILLQFMFIYRYISQDYDTPFKKTLPPLFFTGLFFGIGAAAKWSSLYLAPVLALLWLWYQILRRRHFVSIGAPKEFWKYLLKTILASILFIIVIPVIIYYLSYIPWARAAGHGVFSRGMVDLVIGNQQLMFSYHANIVAEHPFSSTWFQWVFNLRPILYYRSHHPNGLVSLIAAFGNPLLHWGGLLAIFAMPVAAIRRGDGRAAAIVIAYAMLLAPWMVISRLAFAYHYFPNLIFLTLALAYVFDHLIRRERGYYKTIILIFTGLSALLFFLFYPVLSGHPTSVWYIQNVLRWFPSWPF